MNSIQEKLIKTLQAYGFRASWEHLLEDDRAVTVRIPGEPPYIAVEKKEGEVLFLEFDYPETLEGCSLTAPSHLWHKKPEYRQAFEIALGVYYASIGGATAYSPETNQEFNDFATKYGGL